MYASIWTFKGEPSDLERRYEALAADIGDDAMKFHACARTDDGLVVFDTCPSEEAFESFREADWFHEVLTKHGLPRPEIRGLGSLIGAWSRCERVFAGAANA